MSLWFAKIPKEEYINRNIVWVPLCTDAQRQTLLVETFTGDRIFPVKTLILIHWKKHMENIHYNFCIDEYKSFRHNLMKNDGFIRND